MGWARGTNAEGREVGYAVEATCDRVDCDEKINRGVGHVCGGMHDGGDNGCGRYFCDAHLFISPIIGSYLTGFLCDDCLDRNERAVGGIVFDLAGQVAHRLVQDEQRSVCGLVSPTIADLPDDHDSDTTWDAIFNWARCLTCWEPGAIAEALDEAARQLS